MNTIQEFQYVKREQIVESFNSRKYLNKAKDEELLQSIKEKGILQPLLVRPRDGDDRYEIVFGSRRFKAAEEAGLEDIPVRVRVMTDEEVLEIQVIENIQREDMHPLDQADDYWTLKEKYKYPVEAIAAKVGKSLSDIYTTMKLRDLIPEAKKGFLEDKITASHAILIARLQPLQQKEALKAIFEEIRWSDDEGIMSVRGLMRWLDQNVHLDLHSAAFTKEDCKICSKRTGFLPDLFPDVKKKDTCTDPKCYQAKIQAHIQKKSKELKETEGKKPLRLTMDYYTRNKELLDRQDYQILGKKDKCDHSQRGIVVEGNEIGKVLTVCADKSCKVHFHHGTSSGMTPEERKARADQTAKTKLDKSIREKIFESILEKVPSKFGKKDLALICAEVFNSIAYQNKRPLAKRHGIEIPKDDYSFKAFGKYISTLSLPALHMLLVECVLFEDIVVPYSSKEKDVLIDFANIYKINHEDIKKELTSAFEAFEEKKAEKEKKAKKKEIRIKAKADEWKASETSV